jgi:hypothetical protein
MVKDLRLAGISSMAAANAWLAIGLCQVRASSMVLKVVPGLGVEIA